MAVFTPLNENHISGLLQFYDLGALRSYEPIEQGTQNSNFHVYTDRGGHFILTLFEGPVGRDDVSFFIELMNFMSHRGIPCPEVVRRNAGDFIGHVEGRHAILVSFLDGGNVPPGAITPDHCRQLGSLLARLHKAGRDFPRQRESHENAASLKEKILKVETRMAAADKIEKGITGLILREFESLAASIPPNLPVACVHTDIFPDNVFFKDGKISGIIDFYYSCTEYMIYDLLIALNAWCFDEKFEIDRQKVKALLDAYDRERTLGPLEKENLSFMGRAAALRFLVTRLHDWVFHDPKNLVTPRDPREYLAKLRFHQNGRLLDG